VRDYCTDSRVHYTCAINLSGATLCEEQLIGFILEQFKLTGISPATICFELTETTAITNLDSAATLIRELQQIGCRFALDDFGSGMSSFGYLKTLPVDYIKIDGSFVKDMLHDSIDRAMVEAINNIGHVMGMQTIAEFVEDDAIRQALQEMGVNFAQGYGVGRPEPLNAMHRKAARA
jgi:EAL domain-containing protein (putative c-di-GMP-specific phosphodiesterase class I)